MEQLLEIRSIPIEVEFRVQNARYETRNIPSSFEITRDKGEFSISNTPGRLTMDTVESRGSMGLKSLQDLSIEYRDRGINAAYEATGNYVEEGNMLMDSRGKDAIAQMCANRTIPTFQSELGFSPSVPVNIQWQPQDFSMRYEMDKLNFEWRTSHEPEIEYVPAKLEFTVKEYPRLEIKYLGKPIYVPPSSSPDYTPTAFDMLA